MAEGEDVDMTGVDDPGDVGEAEERHAYLNHYLSINGFDKKNIMECFPSKGFDWWPPVFEGLKRGQGELICSKANDTVFVNDLPDRLHPLFEWNQQGDDQDRWPKFTHSHWLRMKPALLLASYLLYNNSAVRKFFARLWLADFSEKGINPQHLKNTRYGERAVLLETFDQFGSPEHILNISDGRMRDMAPYVRFNLGFNGVDSGSEYGRYSCAKTVNDTNPDVPTLKRVAWLQHRGGIGTTTDLNELLLSYAVHGRITYTNTLYGKHAYPTYPDYLHRAHFVTAITLIHELTHAVEFLKFNWSSDLSAQHIRLDRRLQPLVHADGLADPDREEAACAEMGNELEARLFGGMSIICYNLTGLEYRFFEQKDNGGEDEDEDAMEDDDEDKGGFANVMPLFGLGLEDMEYMRNFQDVKPEQKSWPIPMRWIKWWWSKANLDRLSEQGTDALPPLINEGVEYWAEVKRGDGEDRFKAEFWHRRDWPYVDGG